MVLDPESYSQEKLCGRDTPEVCLIALTPRAEEALARRPIDESEPLITVRLNPNFKIQDFGTADFSVLKPKRMRYRTLTGIEGLEALVEEALYGGGAANWKSLPGELSFQRAFDDL